MLNLRVRPRRLCLLLTAIAASAAASAPAGASAAPAASQWLPDPTYGSGGVEPIQMPGGGLMRTHRFRHGVLLQAPNGGGDYFTRLDAAGNVVAAGRPALPGNVGVREIRPHQVLALDQDGRMYVTQDVEQRQDELFRLTPLLSEPDTSFAPWRTEPNRPMMLAAAPHGDGVLISEGYSASAGRIVRLRHDGSRDAAWPEIATPSDSASCLTTRDDGSFVARYKAGLVGYTSGGQPEATFGNGGTLAVPPPEEEVCPTLLADGSVFFHRTLPRRNPRSREKTRTELVYVTRNGQLRTKTLTGWIEDVVPVEDGSVLLVMAGRGLSLLGDRNHSVIAVDAELQRTAIAGVRKMSVPSGRGGDAGMEAVLVDERRALVALSTDGGVARYGRITFGNEAAATRPSGQPPRLSIDAGRKRNPELLTVRFNCAAACSVARLDSEERAGRRSHQHTPALLERGRRVRFRIGVLRTPRRYVTGHLQGKKWTGTGTIGIRARVTDGFGRTNALSVSYRVRCWYQVRGDVGYSDCRRISPVRKRRS